MDEAAWPQPAPLTALLSRCQACPRRCGVDRSAGRLGYCRIGALARVSHAGLHFGEEPPISGTRGSGTIFFAGCNLRCVFCQNHQISQGPEVLRAPELTTGLLASEMVRLEQMGAHNINLVSPSHVAYQAADAIAAARRRGLRIPIVYNSNGYDSLETLRALRGLVEIYLPDLKYQDGDLAGELSDAPDYPEVVGPALAEMLEQVGPLMRDGRGVAVRGVLVRHLVLPTYTSNSLRCLRLLAEIAPEAPVSLMAQYAPRHRARWRPRINRPLGRDEYEEVLDAAGWYGLNTLYVQELASQELCLPDFDREQPFAFG
jgi:putative pyruvate formate lyase activating enzyme